MNPEFFFSEIYSVSRIKKLVFLLDLPIGGGSKNI